MLRRNSRENHSIDSPVQRFNHPGSDGSEANYRNPQVSSQIPQNLYPVSLLIDHHGSLAADT
jgi:hypothetical protein